LGRNRAAITAARSSALLRPEKGEHQRDHHAGPAQNGRTQRDRRVIADQDRGHLGQPEQGEDDLSCHLGRHVDDKRSIDPPRRNPGRGQNPRADDKTTQMRERQEIGPPRGPDAPR
jgi:hypothetical protein